MIQPRFTLLLVLFVIFCAASYSEATFAASGDVIPPILEKKTEHTAVLTIPLSQNYASEKAARDAVAKLSWNLNYNKEKFTFQLPPDGYTIEKKNFVVFYGMTLPVSATDQPKDFPSLTRYSLALPKQVLAEYIEKNMIPKINKPKQDVTITRTGSGTIVFEGTAENGQAVDINAMVKGITAGIEQNIATITVPVLEQPGRVLKGNLGDLNVTELLSTGLSDFAGSPANRIHNIEIGIKRFDGVVIKQGETFSFNDQLGPVEAYTGFLPELVIKGPDTIPEFGGGLCQTSTTAYRAALYAGLPILERRNHSYAVTYYAWPNGWGFDATIYIGVVDLKFTNDTPGDILIQAYTDDTKLYYKFYGVKDTRKVVISDPVVYGRRGAPPAIQQVTSSLAPGVKRIKANAHPGLSAYFTRSVVYPDGKELNEKVVSVYQARPAVYLVGASSAPAGTGDEFYTGDIAPE